MASPSQIRSTPGSPAASGPREQSAPPAGVLTKRWDKCQCFLWVRQEEARWRGASLAGAARIRPKCTILPDGVSDSLAVGPPKACHATYCPCWAQRACRVPVWTARLRNRRKARGIAPVSPAGGLRKPASPGCHRAPGKARCAALEISSCRSASQVRTAWVTGQTSASSMRRSGTTTPVIAIPRSALPPRRANSINVTSVSRRLPRSGASSRACLSSGEKGDSMDSELISNSVSASFRLSQSAESPSAVKNRARSFRGRPGSRRNAGPLRRGPGRG